MMPILSSKPCYEDLLLKQRVFQELDRICSRSAILASNTSALSISAIGSATKRPDKVIGLHFSIRPMRCPWWK